MNFWFDFKEEMCYILIVMHRQFISNTLNVLWFEIQTWFGFSKIDFILPQTGTD